MQPDLFRRELADLSLTPEPGRNEPRLWVRRLVIWRDRTEVVRDIALRPGLNVVWSPDAATAGAVFGHGGGKTTFCRLLRFCLGEDSFAPAGQRRAMFERMPEGRVGAEIRLAGQDWAVVRRFSAVHDDWALPNASLDDPLDSTKPTGMEPFRSAATKALLGDAVPLMPKPIGEAGAWPAVLAWLTRDQECRFSHLLDWRDKDSDSNSPIRNRSVEDRLTVVRAVLGALRAEELAAEAAKEIQAEVLRSLRTTRDRLEWQALESRRELARDLGLDPDQPMSELDAVMLRRAAQDQLTRASGYAAETSPAAIGAARQEQDRLTEAMSRARSALDVAQVRTEEATRIVKMLEAELPELSARAQTVPLCPVCHVPIDKARAEGCGISLRECDTEALQERFARAKTTYEQEQAEAARLQGSLPALQHARAVAEQQSAQQRTALDRLLRVALSRSSDVRRAQRLLDDAGRYERLLSRHTAAVGEVTQAEHELERLRGRLAEYRATVAGFVRRFSERCDQVVRHLVPGDVQGRALLDGNGLHLHVEMGGDRTTAAIESLKVIVFDLAALTLSVEGWTEFPGFLVHDSPREADLDISIYHRLFALVQALERFGTLPLFQYIVTTTTAPPEDIVRGDWLRLTLHGAPASERLFGMDL